MHRFLLPRSSPAFCFLLLSAPGDGAPDGKRLLSRSLCWKHPLPSAPARHRAWCSADSCPGGSLLLLLTLRQRGGPGVRAQQGQTLIPAGPLWVLCVGQPQLPIGWSRAELWSSPGREAAGTAEALPRHRSRQPTKPDGHLALCPAPPTSPTLTLLPSPALWTPGLSLYCLCPTAHQHTAQVGNVGFPNNSVLLPPAANVVVRHQPLSILEGWLHFVPDCKGETQSCQDTLCIPAPGHGKGWPSSPV